MRAPKPARAERLTRFQHVECGWALFAILSVFLFGLDRLPLLVLVLLVLGGALITIAHLVAALTGGDR